MRSAAGLPVLLPLASHMPGRPNLALFVPIMLMSALGGGGGVRKLLRDGIKETAKERGRKKEKERERGRRREGERGERVRQGESERERGKE